MTINLRNLIVLVAAGILCIVDFGFGIGDLKSEALNPKSSSGVDVVLVIDSSGSMKETDPLTLRIPAAKLFISLLNKSDRVGIVSFRDNGYPLIPLTSLDNEANKDLVFKATEKISSKGQFTNLYDALNKGFEVLSIDKSPEKRSKIIILMSDGKMDVGDPDEDRQLIDRLRNELMTRFKDSGVAVYTIAFTEHSDRQLLEEVAEESGGFFNIANTGKDLHPIYTTIFENLKEPDMLPIDENRFHIDKSVQEVTIVATKNSPKTRIHLQSPDGKNYSSQTKKSGIKWFVSYNFEMITVKKPAEGQWILLYSAGINNRAYIITNLKFLTNLEKIDLTFAEPVDLRAWFDKDNSILKEKEILDNIEIFFELSTADGEVLGRSFESSGTNSEDGIFKYRFIPDRTGSYKLRIVAKGKTFERERSFLLNVSKPVKEEKKEVAALKPGKKIEKPAEELIVIKAPKSGKVVEKPIKQKETDKIQWISVITRFIMINLFMGAIVFAYIKRGKLKGLARLPLKKKEGE